MWIGFILLVAGPNIWQICRR